MIVRGVGLFSSDQFDVLNEILFAVMLVPTFNVAAPAEKTASLVVPLPYVLPDPPQFAIVVSQMLLTAPVQVYV